MGNRSTVYNNITTEEKLAQVNKDNIQLGEDFLDVFNKFLKSLSHNKTVFPDFNLQLNRLIACRDHFRAFLSTDDFFLDIIQV